MVTYHRGNLFHAQVDALVNPVNCVGVAGAGLALQFKERFSANFAAYAAACKCGEVQPGSVLVCPGKPTIINFPTKRHWRDPSRMSDIADGLVALREALLADGIKSVAIPPLGCGLGGLDWNMVRSLIETEFYGRDIDVRIYGPAGSCGL